MSPAEGLEPVAMWAFRRHSGTVDMVELSPMRSDSTRSGRDWGYTVPVTVVPVGPDSPYVVVDTRTHEVLERERCGALLGKSLDEVDYCSHYMPCPNHPRLLSLEQEPETESPTEEE